MEGLELIPSILWVPPYHILYMKMSGDLKKLMESASEGQIVIAYIFLVHV